MLSILNKDYSALFARDKWGGVKEKLLRGTRGEMRQNLDVVLANTQRALVSATQMQNIVYLNSGGLVRVI